jgi:hypothetical protein
MAAYNSQGERSWLSNVTRASLACNGIPGAEASLGMDVDGCCCDTRA